MKGFLPTVIPIKLNNFACAFFLTLLFGSVTQALDFSALEIYPHLDFFFGSHKLCTAFFTYTTALALDFGVKGMLRVSFSNMGIATHLQQKSSPG